MCRASRAPRNPHLEIIRVVASNRRKLSSQDLEHKLGEGLPIKRMVQRAELVQDTSQGPDIRLDSVWLVLCWVLWDFQPCDHVATGAQKGFVTVCHLADFWRQIVRRPDDGPSLRFRAHHLGDPEIPKLYNRVRITEDV